MDAYTSNIAWSKRAVVTTGTPYGNKPLHFGHIGGVFVPADCYARFLRDRIGANNVRFVGGTDCYGSPINEGFRKKVEQENFSGTIDDYVMENHVRQKATLDAFNISLDIFEGSGIGRSGEIHQIVSENFINALKSANKLKLESTMQFFDNSANTFLNGRQVRGYCPVQGCKSSVAYADECELGHQYDPTSLINPISTLTGEIPVMKPVENWYFALPDYLEYLKSYVTKLENSDTTRAVVPKTISEFLGEPIIYIKNDLQGDYEKVRRELPNHVFKEAEKGKQSFEIVFDNVDDRDVARDILKNAGIRFRTSKALVDFRITGNIEWGVHAPVIDGVEDLTVWCWPESLWQPISYVIALNESLGESPDSWKDFWCSDDARVYQFLGQDNIYFYGVAQTAMFEAVKTANLYGDDTDICNLHQTNLLANYHLLFGKSKASSSGDIKPPSGEDLLEHYTVDQIRSHFLALGIDQKPMSFNPKPFDPNLTEEQRHDNRIADPVLKEAALLNNVFNRLARSCFYEADKVFDGDVPILPITEDVVKAAHDALKDFEACMFKTDIKNAQSVASEFIRYAQKYWADKSSELGNDDGRLDEHNQLLCDCLYMLHISALMMHGFAPNGCELICKSLGVDFEKFFNWNNSFTSLGEIFKDETIHLEKLPPRFDFFPKHESQFKK